SSNEAWNSDYANHWYIADVSASSDNPQPYTPGTDGIQVGESSKSAKTVEIGWNIPVTTEANSMKFEVSF
ncbi:hypothetical protein LIQ92_18405, partial [Fusicatenibacter saccharivorans]|nr:hypothetical protein [Fusicatenibacter saccharivorans]